MIHFFLLITPVHVDKIVHKMEYVTIKESLSKMRCLNETTHIRVNVLHFTKKNMSNLFKLLLCLQALAGLLRFIACHLLSEG